jgi:hypothetical protein
MSVAMQTELLQRQKKYDKVRQTFLKRKINPPGNLLVNSAKVQKAKQ